MIKFFDRIKIGLFVASILLAMFIIRDQRATIERYKASEGMLQGGDISKAQYIDSLQHVIDSLHSEILPTQIELGRYQVAYEIFAERNPKAASQYGDIISNETE